MIKLSVIIPVYNVEDYVGKCLDSLTAPALASAARGEAPEYEIIAVNDGSTDSSAEIVQNYVNRYPCFIQLISTENQGQGHARNVGTDAARGEFLYFIDSDDYLAPGAMQELLDSLGDDFDIMIFDSVSVNSDGKEISYYSGCRRDGSINLREFPELLLENPICGGSVCRRHIYADNGIRFPSRVWFEDFRTLLKLYALTDRIVHVPRAWHRYLQRPGSVTNNRNPERNLEIIPAVDDLIQFYTGLGRGEELADVLEYMAFHHEFLTASVRVNLADPKSPAQDTLMETFLTEFPNYADNPYIKSMGRRHKLLTWLLMRKRRMAVHLIMKVNNLIKDKKV